MDSASKAFQGDPRRLALVFDADAGGRAWQPGELKAILRHQLAAPVEFEAVTTPEDQGAIPRSFAELFAHPCPPLELLRQTKEFAKLNRTHPDSVLPHEVATVLYYASIVAARVRCNARISQLDDPALRMGIAWALDQEWLDPQLRPLFLEGLARIGPSP